jgi:hypothetical protein
MVVSILVPEEEGVALSALRAPVSNEDTFVRPIMRTHTNKIDHLIDDFGSSTEMTTRLCATKIKSIFVQMIEVLRLMVE